MYRIAICMWYDDNIKEYALITNKINERYSNLMNYDFIVSNKKYFINRHPSWEKLKLCYDVLNNNEHDYVVWIDADACFNYKSDLTLENIINNYLKKDIILCKDYNNINIHNTGFFILKNSLYSKKFIKHLMDDKLLKKYYLQYSWEQQCIDLYYKNNFNNIVNHSVTVPYGILQRCPNYHDNEIGNELVIHYEKTSKERRIIEFNNILKLI